MGNWLNVLAKLHNSEPTMVQWNVTLSTTKKTRKRQQGHFKTLAAASVIKGFATIKYHEPEG